MTRVERRCSRARCCLATDWNARPAAAAAALEAHCLPRLMAPWRRQNPNGEYRP